MRLRFVEALKSHFGDDLDWFGNGIRSVAEKWDGLAPYRYTIVLENHSSQNVLTEKIQDAYLALSYPLYWGAPNVTDYFPEGALTTIDIKDLKGSIATIERVLSEDPYTAAFPALMESKARVLGELNFLHRMAGIARDPLSNSAASVPEPVHLSVIADFESALAGPALGARARAGSFLERAGRRLQR